MTIPLPARSGLTTNLLEEGANEPDVIHPLLGRFVEVSIEESARPSRTSRIGSRSGDQRAQMVMVA